MRSDRNAVNLLRNVYRGKVMDWEPLGFKLEFRAGTVDHLGDGYPIARLHVMCTACGCVQTSLTRTCPSCGRVWCYHIKRRIKK